MTEMALYPVDEVRGLYATISALRQRLQQLGDSAHLGQADVVLLRAMAGSHEGVHVQVQEVTP